LVLGISLVLGVWDLGFRCGSKNPLLPSLHPSSTGSRPIIESVQVQEPVDEIKLKLVFECGAKLSRLSSRSFRADENFAVLKRDHVGRARLIEKLSI
jgi:hypothetical protein